jgi:hypothetical protein
MNTNVLWVVFMCLFCVVPTYAQTSRANQARQDGKPNLAGMERAVLQGQITRCEVFYLPSSIETFSALNPGDVERSFLYKLDINFLASHSKLMTSLCQAIKETTGSLPVPYHGDFRQGFELFDKRGKRVYSVFLDDTGKIAVVNGKRMNLQGGIYSWFNSNFSHRLDGFDH